MKINLVYHTLKNLGSGWMGSEGLRQALERNGLVDYVFNQADEVMGKQVLDIDRLQANPIFFVRGFLNGRMRLVARSGNQFKAAWNSESWFTRHGEEDASTPAAKENQGHFNMMFTCAESDLDKYSVPTYFLPSWADTHVLKEYGVPEYEELGFIGSLEGREDFMNQGDLIRVERTGRYPHNALQQTQEYAKLISKFRYLLSPPGRCFNGMCGRAFEIMACRRLAFVYLNEDTMFKHMEFFKDGEDCVYFKTYDELKEKFSYYKDKHDLCFEIATNGMRKVQEFHNSDVRAKYIVDCMEKERENWLEDQSKISDEMNEVYSSL